MCIRDRSYKVGDTFTLPLELLAGDGRLLQESPVDYTFTLVGLIEKKNTNYIGGTIDFGDSDPYASYPLAYVSDEEGLAEGAIPIHTGYLKPVSYTHLAGMLLAFTTWSVLPFRTEDWDRGKKHALSFLPIVGAFLGILFWLWTQLALRIGINRVPFALLSLALVLIYTGGIHIDGYMDVADAVASHKEKQAKLAILSDPHVGAFAVIKLIVWLLIYVALLHELHYTQYLFVAAGFILSRMAAVITTKVVKPAKQTGMLASLASNHKRLWFDSAIFLAVLIVIGIFYLLSLIHIFINLIPRIALR